MKKGGELGSKMNHFYVEMDASFVHQMIIPKKFSEIIKGSVTKNIKLEGPSGITWHVKMIKSNDTLILQSGWKEFVTGNKIDRNDSLVFTYNGNSSFNVVIFDPTGCEKAAPFFAKKMEMESDESDDSSVPVGAVPHNEVKKEIISLSSSEEVSSHAARGTGERVCCKRKLRESTESNEGNRPVRISEEKRRSKKKFRLYLVPLKTHLTKAQEEIADRMARKAQKGSDLFVKILSKINTYAHRYCALHFPSSFACEVLQGKKQTIILLPADLDKSKGCIAKYYKKKSTRYIGSGWREFVHKNRLEEGDLCIFELRKQEIRGQLVLTMLVHFEMKSEESNDSSVRVGGAPCHEVKKEIISISSGSDPESSSEISSRAARVPKTRERVCSKRKQRELVQESTDSEEGRHRTVQKKKHNNAKKNSRLYIVPHKTFLTKVQEENANRMTQKTQKGSELFVKILTAFNTRALRNCALNLPSGFACEVLQSKKRKIALVPADLDKRSKGCIANYRKNRNMRCIGKGWVKFVRRNRLKEGDFCLFELRKEEKKGKLFLTMVVHFDHE